MSILRQSAPCRLGAAPAPCGRQAQPLAGGGGAAGCCPGCRGLFSAVQKRRGKREGGTAGVVCLGCHGRRKQRRCRQRSLPGCHRLLSGGRSNRRCLPGRLGPAGGAGRRHGHGLVLPAILRRWPAGSGRTAGHGGLRFVRRGGAVRPSCGYSAVRAAARIPAVPGHGAGAGPDRRNDHTCGPAGGQRAVYWPQGYSQRCTGNWRDL